VISHDITFLDFHFPLRGSPGQTLKKSHKGGRVTFLTNVIGTYRGVAQPAAGGVSDFIKMFHSKGCVSVRWSCASGPRHLSCTSQGCSGIASTPLQPNPCSRSAPIGVWSRL